jgi:hypothetical protein
MDIPATPHAESHRLDFLAKTWADAAFFALLKQPQPALTLCSASLEFLEKTCATRTSASLVATFCVSAALQCSA